MPHGQRRDGPQWYGDERFWMFRRAQLMLNRIDRELVTAAEQQRRPLVAIVRLRDANGAPRCARVQSARSGVEARLTNTTIRAQGAECGAKSCTGSPTVHRFPVGL